MADRRILMLGITAILVASLLAGAGSFAYFSDVETSTGNTFTAGTLDLKVSDWDELTFKDGVSATWTFSNMKPGDTVGPRSVWLRNFGSVEADHIEITSTNVVNDPSGPESDTEEGTTDMAQAMEIIAMTYTANPGLLGSLTDWNSNGIIDLEDLETGFDNIKPVPLANQGSQTTFTMTIRFHPTLGDNDYQGDTLTTTIIFTLNQHSSQ